MSRRFLRGLPVLVTTMTFAAAEGASQTPREANTSSSADSWSPPRTPWGHPDYACHEGNYSMLHILSGARAQEKADAGRSNVDKINDKDKDK